MPLDHYEILKKHDAAYERNQLTREKGANDMVFYWITHWDDAMLEDSQLTVKFEFDTLRKAGRQILTDLDEAEVQVDFEPIAETREDAGDLIDGLYRSSTRNNRSIEAFDNADTEAVVCGVGAWELVQEYESKSVLNNNQKIVRMPIAEANNTIFWDPNAKLVDKADAKYVSKLEAYSEEGYRNKVHELTGEDKEEITVQSVKYPEHSYSFPWILGSSKLFYIITFYHVEEVNTNLYTFSDPFGNEITIGEKEYIKIEDELVENGYTFLETEEVVKNRVTRYIVTSNEIIHQQEIAGEYIPIIPIYGEHAYVEGEEHWEGITRLAKDPQRLRNFAGSYLADILSRSPRRKPIFWPEQIKGYEDMYSVTGIDNNFPYVLMNRTGPGGAELPLQPIGELPEQTLPTPLPLLLNFTKESVEDVANPGLPKDVTDPEASGKAVLALQKRIDMQSAVYQKHRKHSRRRDGEVYASMAKELFDVPRTVNIQQPDGTSIKMQTMDQVIDDETGDIVVAHDLTNAEFEVYSKIGPDYASQKEQTLDRIQMMTQSMAPDDPMRQALQLKELTLMDGTDFDDIRDYANKQLLIQGFKKPKTDEEKAMVEEAQKNKKPDPATLLAEAENKKGDAALMAEKRKGIEMQLKASNDKAKNQIDAFEAQTDRMRLQFDLRNADIQIAKDRVDKFGSELDNTLKILDIRNYNKQANKELGMAAG